MEMNINERYGFVGIGSMGGNVATTFNLRLLIPHNLT